MSQANAQLKERVRAFWQANPCGTKFADAPPGSRQFYELVEEHRYKKEWHIPDAAGFDLAKRRFDLFQLPGTFRVADAEHLEFPDNSFDLVYSHGVLHHTPDTAAAVREIHRVLRPGGKAVVMLYHRDSYNYRINISMLRRAGVQLLRLKTGVKLVHLITGEPESNLQDHARQLQTKSDYLSAGEFLSRNTDGAGNPLARVYSRSEARELFKDFAHVELRTYFFNKRWLPVLGAVLPRSLETKLAAKWGWHLWIYATKG